ncbi:MAG: hypothetical protein ACXABG_08140 [Promethearchaeota archaeon]|jgi:hypothetical protein
MVISIFLTPFPLDDILLIVSTLFSPIVNTPDTALLGFGTLHLAPDLLMALLSLLAIIIPPLIAAIVAGRLGDSSKVSFLAWFLTAVISSVVFLLLAFFAPGVSLTLGTLWPSLVLLYGVFGTILYFIVPAIVNGFFYGCIAFLASRD